MNTQMLPAEIWPLQITDELVRNIRPVTSLDIYDGISSNFHDDGLYSTLIFGRVGTEERDNSFSFIDIKVAILHPKIYKDLCSLKGLYKGILSGREVGVWDNDQKDFFPEKNYRRNGGFAETTNTALETGTGYAFFMRHFKDIEFKRNKSPARTQRIELLDKFRGIATTTRIPVIPAGIRDIQIDEGGHTSKDEINDLYYRMLSIANTIARVGDMETEIYNTQRYSLTLTMLEIYSLLERMVAGKKGFMLDKWGSRRIVHGTRNVLTVMNTSATELGAKNAPDFVSTTLGLFQTAKGLTPFTINRLRRKFLDRVFSEGESSVPLIDKRTLRQEYVELAPEQRDLWSTKEGLMKVINRFSDLEARHRPVEIAGRYLALVYRGPDMTFRVFNDIRELPDGFDKKYVFPVTLCELIYLSAYTEWNQRYAYITRYPVTGIDSIYPSKIYVKTTTIGEIRRELDETWTPMGEEFVAYEYPRADIPAFVDSMSPHSSRLVGLGADFDGDTGSATCVMTDEATAEAQRFLQTRQAWVAPDGSMRASVGYDTVNLLLHNLTGRLGYGSNAHVPAVLQKVRG